MQATDFKVGWTVRAVTSTYQAIGLLKGETGIVVDVRPDVVGVRHKRNRSVWSMYPHEIEVVMPKLPPPSATDRAAPSAAADLRLTPQAKTVLSHLKKRGRISPAEANTVYGISRLASCIHEIRNRAGYTVRTEQRRDDHGHKYAKYILAA